MLSFLALQAVSACIGSGAVNITLAGTVRVETAAGDPTHGQPAYRYASLVLDKPLCVWSADTGLVTAATALIEEHRPNLTLPFRFKNRHVTVTAARVTLDPTAPVQLLLEDPTIEPDQN